MNAFNDLKKKAETEKATIQNEVKSNRGWLIAIVVAAITGAVLVKACGG